MSSTEAVKRCLATAVAVLGVVAFTLGVYLIVRQG